MSVRYHFVSADALTTQGFERTKDKARHGAGLLVDGSLGWEHPRESFS